MTQNDEERWFVAAVRAHEKEHGPSGPAWNVSAILDLLRREYEKLWGDDPTDLGARDERKLTGREY